MKSNKRVIIFSHESDIDGMGSIILGRLVFEDIDYVLVPNVNTLETKFREKLKSGELEKYDYIFVTDLALYRPSIDLVKDYKNVYIFDHHRSAISEGYNDYDFSTIIEVDDTGKKRSGTDLFYEFLINNNLISDNLSISEFVELTRLEDTWEWKNTGDKGIKAHDLSILFNSLGIEKYIDRIYTKLYTYETDFEFDEEEKNIINNKKTEYLNLLKNIFSKAEYFKDDSNNSFSALYADYEYRNELAEYVKTLDIDLKYLIIIALEKGAFGQKSYRAIEEGFDVGKIAELHGGSGHPAAASVNITKEQKEHALILRNTSVRESLEYLINSKYEENK